MTFVRLASLLGKVFESEAVLEYKKSFVHELGRDPVRGTVLIMDPTENKLVPIEQLVAHMFKHLMDQAAAHAGFQVKDCVISVPAFYNQLERQAVLDAAKIAGFNVLGLINGVSAAAMYQVATLSDIDSAANYIIYDSGAGDTVAAVVRFENGRAVNRVTARAVDIKAVASESGLGGNLIDDRIAAFLIRKYEEAHPGLKVLPGKSYNKVLLEASRLKKILNANDSAMASLEDIVEYESLNFNVIRDDIEGVLNDLAPRFYAPIESVLKSAKLALKDIKAVLMIGGNSRQQYLLKSLRGQVNNEQLLSFTLDPDEAIVRGATLYAAKLHPAFRVLPMHFHDVLTSGLSVHYRNLDGDGSEKSVYLFAPFSPVNSTKSLSLKNMRSAQVELFHSDSQLKIATATLGGFDKVLSELGDKPILASKLKLPVHVNLMGLVHVESASAILEIEEEITKTVPKTKPAADKQAEDAPKPKSPLEQAAEEQDPAAVDAVEEVEIVKEIVKKERTFPLLSEVKFLAVGMSDEQIKGCIRSLEALREKERAKLALANARNDLEKHIFRLETELSRADFVAFSTDKERSQIRKQLNQASSTLNSAQSSSSSADACLKALSELKKLEDPILNRQTESQQRPASLEELSAAISEAQQYAQQTLLEVTADARPQSDAELTALMQRALDASKWLQEKSKKQASLATSANPALLVHEMDERRVVLRKELAELQGRKPLPPTATIDSDAIQENPTATVQQDEPKPGAPNPAEQAAILEDDAQFNKGPNPTPLPKSKEDPIEEFPEEFERDEL
jgi:hypoxia up-regulated 1